MSPGLAVITLVEAGITEVNRDCPGTARNPVNVGKDSCRIAQAAEDARVPPGFSSVCYPGVSLLASSVHALP